MTVLEGGASTGLYTLTAASLVGPSGRVVAFEPGRRSAEALAKSVALNGFSQVAIRREALSAVQSTSTLYYHRGQDNMLGFGIDDGAADFEEVSTVTVDGVVQALGLSGVHLVRLDIEGAQEQALRGSLETLTRFRPIVLVYVSPSACRRQGVDPEGAARLLAGLDYRFYGVTRDGTVVSVPPVQGGGHFLAAPAGSLLEEGGVSVV